MVDIASASRTWKRRSDGSRDQTIVYSPVGLLDQIPAEAPCASPDDPAECAQVANTSGEPLLHGIEGSRFRVVSGAPFHLIENEPMYRAWSSLIRRYGAPLGWSLTCCSWSPR